MKEWQEGIIGLVIKSAFLRPASGALAGVAVIFLASVIALGNQTIDVPVTIGLMGFSAALPIYLACFFFTFSSTLLGALSAYVAFLIGMSTEEVGIVMILLHISPWLPLAFGAMSLVCIPWVCIVVLFEGKKRRAKQTKIEW